MMIMSSSLPRMRAGEISAMYIGEAIDAILLSFGGQTALLVALGIMIIALGG